VDEARCLIRDTTPVVVNYRQDDQKAPDRSQNLPTSIGAPTPDGEAVARMLGRILRPRTLVFILSAKGNAPVP
jgi:hypothetical protein